MVTPELADLPLAWTSQMKVLSCCKQLRNESVYEPSLFVLSFRLKTNANLKREERISFSQMA